MNGGVIERFLTKGLEHGGHNPGYGGAVGVFTVAGLATVVGSMAALPDPCKRSVVMKVEVLRDSSWYPYGSTSF